MRRPHVLLIEDDLAVREATRLLLNVAGYEVTATACIADAVDRARRSRDLRAVIADYHLGNGEDGIEAIAAVRRVSTSGLPAVLMSGDTGLLLLESDRGPDTAVAQKPIRAEELLALLPIARSGL